MSGKARVLVIGYGNPLRGDDCLGQLAAERLEEKYAQESAVTVVSCQTLTPELALYISEHDLTIFIDAAIEGEPGTIHRQRIEPDPASDTSLVHFLDPQALVQWARQLYQKEISAVLFTLTGENFDMAESALSPVVEEAFPRLLEQVEELILHH